MAAREALHRLVDALPEPELPTAARVLKALSLSAGAPQPSFKASPPAGKSRKKARILSPRLAHPEQGSDFEKQILETPADAGL